MTNSKPEWAHVPLSSIPPPGNLGNILAATRMLLGVWDTTLSQWDDAAPPEPAPDPRIRPPAGAPAASTTVPGAAPGKAPGEAAEHASTRAVAATATATAVASLNVQMLDGFQICVGSEQLQDLPRGKARALLMFLLLNRRRPLSRARLCSLFWPEVDAAAARNNLNVNLHRVRRQLHEPNLLHHSDEGYQILTRGETWLDIEQFQLHAVLGAQEDAAGHAAQSIAHYEVAAALYRTDLVDDSEHEPALMAQSQAQRDRLNQVLERLSSLRETSGDLHGCLRITLRHLGLDECNEVAHRRLMRCYALLGQPQLAERQYRQCLVTLRRQLGLNPSAETTELYRRITRREGL